MNDEMVPAWAQEIRERVVRIETKLDYYNEIRETAYKAKITADNCETTLKNITKDLKWAWRVVISAILSGIVAFYVQLKGGR